MAAEEPIILPVGTEVSAKYRGAFCEAKVKKIVKCVKCKVTISEPRAQVVVLDEDVKGTLKTGAKVEVKHPETSQYVEATFNKLTDCSMYTVVFDDGDENTLRRTQLCLKGEKHFVKSETLDQLPLTHPEHFGTPVMKGYKGSKRRRSNMGNISDSESESEASECSSPRKRIYKGRLQDLIGRVLCMEIDDRKKTTWVPVLVVIPTATDIELKTREHLLVKSFKDGRFYTVARRDTKEFTREMAIKNEDKSLKPCLEKALSYYDTRDVPSSWDREELLGLDSEEEDESDSSDDEPSEEKDHFVAQLYKFMDDRDTPINKAPSVGSRDLNLYRLFKLVRNLGGYNKVTNLMKWKMVYSKMNLPPSSNAYNQIKAAYKKYLHAYEDFYRKLGSTMGNRPGRTRHSSGRSLLSFREREAGQPKSPRATDKKKEEKSEEDKAEDEKKDEDKGKTREAEKSKDVESKGKKSEEKKPASKEDGDADNDSPRKRRSRGTAAEKKAEEKVKEDEKATKRITREDAAKMKEEVKGKEEERSRRSATKKADETEEKEEPPQKKRGTPARTKVGKVEEKTDTKKVPEEPVSDGGPDENSDDDDDDDEEVPPPPPLREDIRKDSRKRELSIGTKLKVRYGRGRNQKIYEAKVIEAEQEGSSIHYLVHYAGWNTRYDEWVQRDRIVSIVSETSDPDKKVVTGKKSLQTKTPVQKKVKRLSSGSGASPKVETKGTKVKTQMTPGSSSKARPTRSSAGDVVSVMILPTRRSRRGSGVGDSASDLQSHMSDSESDASESVTDDKKFDTDDTDSLKTKSDKSSETSRGRSAAVGRSISATAKREKEKESELSYSESEGSEPPIKETKPKVKSDGKGAGKAKLEVKPEPSPVGTELSDDEEPMIVEPVIKKTPVGKSTPTRPTKGGSIKQEEPSSPALTMLASGLTTPSTGEEEKMEVEEQTAESKAKGLLAKEDDAQSEDAILKDLKENHQIDMGDILIYSDSDMPIAPPKLKPSKETSKGKRRKSTDSVDRQDSVDTIGYSYDIQDAVQNILDQLDVGDDDSDDLSFLTPTKEPKETFRVEKKEETKADKPKKKKEGKEDKVKEKGERQRKSTKKAEKVVDDTKQESETEKEKKHEGDKKKQKKKKKMKKKSEGKEAEKETECATSTETTDQDKVPSLRPEAAPPAELCAPAPPPAPVEEVANPPQLAAVTPTKEKDEPSKTDLGVELSPLPPKLQAERPDLPVPDKPELEQATSENEVEPPAPVPTVTPTASKLATTAVPTTIEVPQPLQPVVPKQMPVSQSEALPIVPSQSTTSATPQLAPASVTPVVTLPPAAPAVEASKEPQVPTLPPPAQPSTSSSEQSTPAVLPVVPESALPSAAPKTPVSASTGTMPSHVSPAHQATTAPLFVNTPPETPEGSPVAPPTAEEGKSPPQTASFAEPKSMGAKPAAAPTPATAPEVAVASSTTTSAMSEKKKAEPVENRVSLLPMGGESPNTCDTSTISTGSDGSNGNMPSSEDSTEGSSVVASSTHTSGNKRKQQADDGQPLPKKRKRNSKRNTSSEKGKSTPKHSMSDSDEAVDSGSGSPKHTEVTGLTSPSGTHKITPSKKAAANPASQSPSTSATSSAATVNDEPRPQRPSKYNFNLEDGKYLEGEQRITFIMEKLTEIRKIYMSLKAEVACIDRRRKRAKRREKEGTALALASLANS